MISIVRRNLKFEQILFLKSSCFPFTGNMSCCFDIQYTVPIRMSIHFIYEKIKHMHPILGRRVAESVRPRSSTCMARVGTSLFPVHFFFLHSPWHTSCASIYSSGFYTVRDTISFRSFTDLKFMTLNSLFSTRIKLHWPGPCALFTSSPLLYRNCSPAYWIGISLVYLNRKTIDIEQNRNNSAAVQEQCRWPHNICQTLFFRPLPLCIDLSLCILEGSVQMWNVALVNW